MDFVPLPRGVDYHPIEVPCHATESYDGDDFREYPNRKGWGRRSVQQWLDIFRAPPESFIAFLQTWLYFGLIEVVFGRAVSLDSFIQRDHAGRRFISTSTLKEWIRRRPKLYFRSQQEKVRVLTALVCASRIHWQLLFKHFIFEDPGRRPSLEEFIGTSCLVDPRDPGTVASMALLLEILSEYLVSTVEPATSQYIKGCFSGGSLLDPWDNVLNDRLRTNGWCISERAVMSRRVNAAALSFMCHLDRPRADRQHKVIRILPHQGRRDGAIASNATQERLQDTPDKLCTKQRCAFLQLNDETYETKHAEGCDRSSCYDMIADEQHILEILRSGSIPLILSISDGDEDRSLTLISSGPDFEFSYVAISHVWSDGLGNVQRSALPRCQILHLSNLIRHLSGKAHDTILFWIDTIGCPPDVAGQNEAQELAIGMMRQTYENATAVLVLDSWLQTQMINSMPDYQILMMIICCAWNSRLWTLQEGALAQALYFQFRDHAYNVDEGMTRLAASDDMIIKLSLLAPISERVHEVRGFAYIETSIRPRLNALRAALCYRSTSVETDEALCLAALLDIGKEKLTAVIRAPPRDRMRKLWSLLDEVPSEIFFSRHARLEVDGYHWAPKTFLRDPRNSVEPNAMLRFLRLPPAKRTSNGLQFPCPGFMMYAGKNAIGPFFYARDEDGVYYKFDCDTDEHEKSVNKSTGKSYEASLPTDYSMYDIGFDHTARDMSFCTFNHYELCSSEIICFVLALKEHNNENNRGGIRDFAGVFVSFKYLYNGVIHVQRLFGGSYTMLQVGVNDGEMGRLSEIPIQRSTRLGDEPGFLPTLSMGIAHYPDGRLAMTSLRTLPNEQYWCVE